MEMFCTHLNYKLNWSVTFSFNCACVVKPLASETVQTWHSLVCAVKTEGKTVRVCVWGSGGLIVRYRYFGEIIFIHLQEAAPHSDHISISLGSDTSTLKRVRLYQGADKSLARHWKETSYSDQDLQQYTVTYGVQTTGIYSSCLFVRQKSLI